MWYMQDYTATPNIMLQFIVSVLGVFSDTMTILIQHSVFSFFIGFLVLAVGFGLWKKLLRASSGGIKK